VIRVRIAVLVEAEQARRGERAALELGCELGRQRGGYHGQIEGNGSRGEELEQCQQSIVVPASVVVAEEERHPTRCRIEFPAERVEPTIHG
jgi:hypothetical protein